MSADPGDVRIELLGRFRVALDGRVVVGTDWPARRAQELVALLALAADRRLLREQVIEQLWPHLGAQAGAANLRKAAHHARRTMGDPQAIVLRSGREEMRLARLEMQQKAKHAGIGAGMFGAAGTVALFGAGALVATAILVLATAIAAWLATLIVAVVLLAGAGAIALAGRRQLAEGARPVPEQAIQSVHEDIDEIKARSQR